MTLYLKVVVILSLTLVFGAAPLYAQSATTPADPHHPSAATPAPAPGGMGEPREGSTMPMMDMCRQMMAGPMMGMSGDQKMDPKMMAHMLQMRGEMMKAMGDVMMKHGKMMQGGATRPRFSITGELLEATSKYGVNTDGSTPSSAWISWHDATKFRRPKSNFVAQPRNWWPDRTGATSPPLSAVVRRPIHE